MTLPAGWTARRPTLDDVPAILAVVHAADTFAIGHPDFDAEDVEQALTAPYFDPSRDSWLALDPDDTVVAWATVDNPTGVGREFVEVYVDPERAANLRAPLLARQLDRVAERAAGAAGPLRRRPSCGSSTGFTTPPSATPRTTSRCRTSGGGPASVT
ncbi:hypothetical protein ACLQ25_30405 [Micromonospora sp. DT44]|uniref:hypothetical protein n=1 Tax=Micromonospora sp. DT44 TaxID=3393439 RepID=UPI003CF99442